MSTCCRGNCVTSTRWLATITSHLRFRARRSLAPVSSRNPRVPARDLTTPTVTPSAVVRPAAKTRRIRGVFRVTWPGIVLRSNRSGRWRRPGRRYGVYATYNGSNPRRTIEISVLWMTAVVSVAVTRRSWVVSRPIRVICRRNRVTALCRTRPTIITTRWDVCFSQQSLTDIQWNLTLWSPHL